MLQCVSSRNISGYNLAKGYRDLHPDPPLLTRIIYHDARGEEGGRIEIKFREEFFER